MLTTKRETIGPLLLELAQLRVEVLYLDADNEFEKQKVVAIEL